MPLTVDCRETVRAQAARDSAFREAPFQETVQTLLGPGGNPASESLYDAIGVLRAKTGEHLELRAVAGAA